MKGSFFNVVGDFFGLDIGSTAARVVQLKGSGANRTLVRYGSIPLDSRMSLSDAPVDQSKIAEIVRKLVVDSGISTKNVAVGLPSSKTFATVVDLPKVSDQDLANTLKYQADQYIPMPLDEAKLDWQVLGNSPVEENKSEVLLASVAKKFSETRLDMLESIGLNVVALEPDALAIARSLSPLTGNDSAKMIIDMGENATDIIVTLGGAPRLIRSIPSGGQSLVRSATQNLNVDENQARQLVFKFGLDKTKLEGQVYRALESSIEVVTSEAQKSLKFFTTRYQNTQLSGIVTAGVAATIPGFHQYLSKGVDNAPVEAGNCWQNVNYSNDLHEQLMSISQDFAVAAGLAERNG